MRNEQRALMYIWEPDYCFKIDLNVNLFLRLWIPLRGWMHEDYYYFYSYTVPMR